MADYKVSNLKGNKCACTLRARTTSSFILEKSILTGHSGWDIKQFRCFERQIETLFEA